MRDVETEVRKRLKDEYDKEYNRIHRMYQKTVKENDDKIIN